MFLGVDELFDWNFLVCRGTAGVLYDLADGGWVERGGGTAESGNDTRLPNAPDRLTPPPPGNRLVEEDGVRRGSDSSDDGGGGGTETSSS